MRKNRVDVTYFGALCIFLQYPEENHSIRCKINMHVNEDVRITYLDCTKVHENMHNINQSINQCNLE